MSSHYSKQGGEWESWNSRDFSNWKLCPLIVQRINSQFCYPRIDPFASPLWHQLENYLSWRLDPGSKGMEAMVSSVRTHPIRLPSFLLDNKIRIQESNTSSAKFIAKYTKGGSSISGKQNIKVRGLEGFRESLIVSVYQSQQPVLSPVLEGQV